MRRLKLQSNNLLESISNSDYVKNDKTNEVVLNYEISTLDEFFKLKQFIKDFEAKGTSLFDVGLVGLLEDVKNGKEVAQALNMARGARVFT